MKLLLLLLLLTTLYAREIRIGFTAVITKEDTESIQAFVEYLSKRTGLNFKPIFAKSYDEMDYFLAMGLVDVGYICGGPYVEGRERYGYRILAVPLNSEGKPYYYSLVVTRVEKPYRRLTDFKGKPYAFSDPKSNSGSLVPTYELLKRGIRPSEFFKPVVYTYSHYESILAVQKGFVEGASVDSLVYKHAIRLNPGLARELKVVEVYGPYPTKPIVYRTGLDRTVLKKLREALLSMGREEEGKRVLEALGISGFSTVEESFYEPIRHMLNYVKKNGAF
ncbi:MAG: phosphate/phosphite/phosphonate ABC transporter substrate-binding protein [Aquificaceae bacterium]|nr:phosphate/phosphite/phosphonate ABC transporter substrate-binding protein [Aquificaceae bacterium]